METVTEYPKDALDYYTPKQKAVLRALLKEGHDAIARGEFYTIEEVCQHFGIDSSALS